MRAKESTEVKVNKIKAIDFIKKHKLQRLQLNLKFSFYGENKKTLILNFNLNF